MLRERSSEASSEAGKGPLKRLSTFKGQVSKTKDLSEGDTNWFYRLCRPALEIIK